MADKILCSVCGKEVTGAVHSVGDKDYCDDCFSEKFKTCAKCGALYNVEDMKIAPDGKDYCSDCYDDNVVECEDCGEAVFIDRTTQVDGNYVCDDCLASNYTTCEDCGELIKNEDIVEVDGKKYCENCADERTVFCRECEERIPIDDAVEVDGEYYCERCADDVTVVCSHCGTRVHTDSAHSDDYIHLCERCYNNYYYVCDDCGCFVRDNNVQFVDDRPYCDDCAPESTIHDYGYKPTPRFFGGTKSSFFFGFELEVDKGGEDNRNAKQLLDVANADYEHVYCKHDGSIHNGFEIVSHPMTAAYILNELPLEEMTDKLKSMGYNSHDSQTCGFHIHVSRSGFGDNENEQDLGIMKVLFFVERFWDKMVKFSRRSESKINQWARRYGMKDTPEQLLETAKDEGRYFAVNLNNDATIELRLFRGSLNLTTLKATVQFTSELCRIMKEISMEELQSLTWNDFILNRVKRYPELLGYLNKRGLLDSPDLSYEELMSGFDDDDEDDDNNVDPVPEDDTVVYELFEDLPSGVPTTASV